MIEYRLIIMNPYDITLNTWNKLVQVYQDKFMNLDLYNDTYDVFYDHLSPSLLPLLELGCGPGNIAAYLLKRNANLRFHLTDGAPDMLKQALKNNPSATGSVLDARHLHTLTGPYAGIIAGFCLPYLSPADAVKWITDSHSLLVENGVLYLSFIEGKIEQSGFQTGSTGDQMYVYYHEAEVLKHALAQAGFKHTQVFRKSYTRANGTLEAHCIIIAKKIKCHSKLNISIS